MINHTRRLFLLLLFYLLIFLFIISIASPAQATNRNIQRDHLTLGLLQEKIANPLQSEGVTIINLQKMAIDLSDHNAEFSEQFYQQLQNKINRAKTPIGLDFTNSLIRGEFNLSKLGLPIPLTEAVLSSMFTPIEQKQLQQDRRFLMRSVEQISAINVFRGALKINQTIFTGSVDLSNSFFLQKLEANHVIFDREVDLSKSRFARTVDFSNANFGEDINLSQSQFFDRVNFSQAQFTGMAKFIAGNFHETVNFSQARFKQLANFNQTRWLQTVKFDRVIWNDRVLFAKNIFLQNLSLSGSTLEKSTAFRGSNFYHHIDLKDVSLLEGIDFSNAIFYEQASINVAGLAFDADKAKIIGDTGVIGKVISVPVLEGNENVLRNLVRNFRSLEQIPDADRIEYQREKLKLRQISDRITNVSWQDIWQLSWLAQILYWWGLAFLLLLSDYGTNFSVVFGIGTISVAYFGLIFWFVDRYRRRFPTLIAPNRYETICMLASFSLLTLFGTIEIIQNADRPVLTFISLMILLLPLPLSAIAYLYKKGRYHNLLDVTYFVEDGSMRQFRLMIGRLPIVPRFPFFRDRYEYILWERRWNWLNYYDFSLNNLLKLGFNDIRLRDQHLPGIVSTLVWYQWCLGVLYITLLLWTLSRTIPGLNLLIYF